MSTTEAKDIVVSSAEISDLRENFNSIEPMVRLDRALELLCGICAITRPIRQAIADGQLTKEQTTALAEVVRYTGDIQALMAQANRAVRKDLFKLTSGKAQ